LIAQLNDDGGVVGLLLGAKPVILNELCESWEPALPWRLSTNIPPHLGVVRVVANSRIVCRYPMIVVWHVHVILETYHFL
jgi:hypothetical protein